MALSAENKAKRVEGLRKRLALIADSIRKTQEREASLRADQETAEADLAWLQAAPVLGNQS